MDWQIAPESPIYAQLAQKLRRGIASGLYGPGEKLPPVRELALEAGVNPNTMLSESEHTHHDHFDDIHPTTSWKQGLEYAQSIGLGTMEYDLITIK